MKYMKKIMIVILCALLFGGVAGATILTVSRFSASRGVQQTEVSEEAQDNGSSAGTAAESIGSNIQKSSQETQAQATDAGSAASSSGGTYLLDVSDVVEAAMPQVVSIINTMVIEEQGYSSLYDYFYGGGSTREYEVPASGSGVILEKTDDELLIVTNNHVIEDAKTLTVTFVDGTSVDANVKGADSVVDVAVIAVPLADIPEDTLSQIKVATYHDSEDLKVGQGVIAIGNALGYGQTVTVGVISALDREITAEGTVYSGLIQTDAAINPGNSGGALINMNGEVIGINVAKLSSTSVEGFGYSIPIYKVMDVIETLTTVRTKIELDESEKGRVGIYMNTISDSNAQTLGIPAGVIIRGFSDEYMSAYGLDSVQESPARDAGLLKNDIITKFDGQSVTTAEQLSALVSYYEKGSNVTITYQRLIDGEYVEQTAEVTLGAADDPVIDPINPEDVPEGAARDQENAGGNKWTLPFGGGNGKDEGDTDAGEDSANEDSGRQSPGANEFYDLFKDFLDQYR